MKNKKLIFSVLFTGILFLNTFLFTSINENRLQLNSLFTLATAQTECLEFGETFYGGVLPGVTIKPDEVEKSCHYYSGFSVGGSIGFPSGIGGSYTINYSLGTKVECEDRGDGCTPRECS